MLRSISGPALLPDGTTTDVTLEISAGRIQNIIAGASPTADRVVHGTIVPGLIDLQINGAFGADFTASPETVDAVAARLPEQGVTGFLPTLITSPFSSYTERLAAVRTARTWSKDTQDPESIFPSQRFIQPAQPAARVLGVHLEGPYLNPQRRGAHNPAWLRLPDIQEIRAWTDPAAVSIVTLAPELPQAILAIQQLASAGIVVSTGHSTASYDQAMAAFSAGASWGTHLFNAMNPLLHREPSLPGALIASNVPCGIIADGIHIHPAVIKMVYQAKGAGQITLVTDAMEAMGMSPGRYSLAEQEVLVTEADARLADGTLAGSILKLNEAVRNMMAFTGCSLGEAVAMASTTPARLLGLGDCLGAIQPGYWADITVLDGELHPQLTLVGGRVAYSS